MSAILLPGGVGGVISAGGVAFRFTVSAASGGFTLPLVNGGTYDFLVNWGDGSPVGIVTAWNDADRAHTYGDNASYHVSITGTMSEWDFSLQAPSSVMLNSVDSWGNIEWESMASAFSGCANLAMLPAGGNFSGVQDWTECFKDCEFLTTIPYITFAASPLCDFTDMFDGATSLESFLAAGVNNNISFEDCNFDAAGLNVIFAGLSTVSGKTITITGNPGEATCDRTIATGKGWTVLPAIAASDLLLESGSRFLLEDGASLILLES